MTPDGPQLDADRAFALSQVPVERRSAVAALWQLDAALGAVLAGGREPLISQIKLAWWREALAKLDTQEPPPEPVLREVAAHVLPDVSGAELSLLEGAWGALLSGEPLTPAELDSYAASRGLLFRYSARLLTTPLPPELERAGEAWALVDLARHSNKADAEAALEAVRERAGDRARWPRPLRPLGMLAVLARRDAERGLDAMEPHGVPPRVARMLRHRLTGG